MMLPKRKPTVNKPRMPPTIASPHAFRCTATMPPTSVKIERAHPIIPQVSKIDWSIDWSCSIEKGESGGSTIVEGSSIEGSNAKIIDQNKIPSNPAIIKKIPAISGFELGWVGCWFWSG